MKTVSFVAIILLLRGSISLGQEINLLNFNYPQLLAAKRVHENCLKDLAKSTYRPLSYLEKCDSAKKAYFVGVANLKSLAQKSPLVLDSLINYSLVFDSTKLYYYDIGLKAVFDFNKHLISKANLYRIIKHELLEKNANTLPDKFYRLPYIDRRAFTSGPDYKYGIIFINEEGVEKNLMYPVSGIDEDD